MRDSGVQALVEDLGRPGHAQLGVAVSGAFDRRSLRLANRLVGNPEGAACIEALLGGLSIEFTEPVVVAVTGAGGDLRVGGRSRPRSTPLYLRPGDTLTLGAPVVGIRSYVAVAGGLRALPRLLGSAATDPTNGLGPPPLRTGDVLELGPEPTTPPPHVELAESATVPAGEVTLRAAWGPRADWITEGDRRALTSARWVVSADSDRVGTRLEGPVLERAVSGELPSEAMIRGAVQVPSSGQPVVLGPDHPTTGGYPVPLVVADPDTDRLGQLAPGVGLRFDIRRLPPL